MQGPAHGYRIKKIFAPFVSRDGLNDGQVYPVLTQLEKQNLVRKETVRQRKSPNKNLYHITEQGREEFLRWLTGPEDEVDPVKYGFFLQHGFLMKYSFFEHLSVPEQKAKLRYQIESARQKIGEYEQIRNDLVARKLGMHKIRIVDFGIETQKLKIRWAKEMLKDLGRGGSSGSRGRARSSAADASSGSVEKSSRKKG